MRTIAVTGVPTHHFFVAWRDRIMRDAEGNIIVFVDREKAAREARIAGWKKFVVVGMGDAKWELFQREEKHVIV